MKIASNAVPRLICLLATIFISVATTSPTFAGDLKLQAQLIWGTNDPKSPDPNHKPVTPEVKEKLKSLPLKWTNFFEVNRQEFAVAENTTNKVAMSKDCVIMVKNLGNSTVEMCIVGKGERACKITRSLPKGELLVTGGNAPNLTGWFVVLKQVE